MPEGKGKKASKRRYPAFSDVMRFFQPDLSLGGVRFAEKCIPAEWKPRLIQGDVPYELQYDHTITISFIFQLDKFSFAKTFTGDVLDRAHELKAPLSAWLRRFEGIQIFDFSASIPPGRAHWRFTYRLGRNQGLFSVWFLPVGKVSTTMIAEVTEWVSREKSSDTKTEEARP